MTFPFRTPTHHSEWQARALKRDLTSAEVCLVECMAAAGLPPHLSVPGLAAAGLPPHQNQGWLGPLRPKGLTIASRTVRTNLATWNSDRLTRLVFAAHDACAQLSVTDAGPYVRVVLHLRDADPTDLSTIGSHPTLEEAVAGWRTTYPARATPEK